MHQGAHHGKRFSFQYQCFTCGQARDTFVVSAACKHIVPALKSSLVKATAGEGAVFQHIIQICSIQPHYNGCVFTCLGELVEPRHPVRESRLGFFECHGLVVGLVIVVHHPLAQGRIRRQGHLPALECAHRGNFRAGFQFRHHFFGNALVMLVVPLVGRGRRSVGDGIVPGGERRQVQILLQAHILQPNVGEQQHRHQQDDH